MEARVGWGDAVTARRDPREIDVVALRTMLEAWREEMLDDLAALVSLETPSTDRSCLHAGLAWLRRRLGELIGTPADCEVIDGGQYGDILVAGYRGHGQRPVAMLCHYDTVWDRGTVDGWPFSVDGDRASGPGIFDMKAGIVQALWALRASTECGMALPPVRILFNGDEEIGSPASRPVIKRVCQDAAAVLVFEPSAAGAIKTARKGVGIYRVELRGVEAHAGLDPTKGASAVHELARQVTYLCDLADAEAGTTVNVGIVSGGTRTNVTAGHAVAEIDVRAKTAAEARRVHDAIANLGSHDPRVNLTVTGDWNRPVMERTEDVARMYDLASVLADLMGIDLPEAAVGGGSDGNFAAAAGLPVLDGLGAVGGGAHARHEHVSVAAMTERAALAAAVLHTLAET